VTVLPASEAIGGLILVFLATVPLGAVGLRVVERFAGRRWAFTPLERLLVAFYGAGGLLFVLASLPAPVFTQESVLGLLAVGLASWLALCVRERARNLAPFFEWLRSTGGLVVAFGTFGLLVTYVLTMGTANAANGLDGPVHTLFVQLLLQNHSIPLTLSPYQTLGVEYPQGAPVWEALPVLIVGWPILASPVLLPCLFLSLTIPAAFSWGERVGGIGRASGLRMGLLFSAFFGLLASWPRLFIGGSYDFMFALPLLLLLVGWLPALSRRPLWSGRQTIVLGAFLGVSGALSGTMGLEFAVLIAAGYLAYALRHPQEFGRVGSRFALVASIGVAFLARSFYGVVLWFNQPGHILSAAGSPPYVLLLSPPSNAYRYVTGELDPFVLWKAKLSPVTYLSLELAVLLAIGGVMLVAYYIQENGSLKRLIPADLGLSIAVGTSATFLLVSFLVAVEFVNGPLAFLRAITYIEEFSFALFFFYEAIALLPLVFGLRYLEESYRNKPASVVDLRPTTDRPSVIHARPPSARERGRWMTVVAIVLLAQPLALGAYATATAVPGYLTTHVQEFANVTPADFDALLWAGQNLPGCSHVMTAPGSAARYLPLYATLTVVTLEPYHFNLSYNTSVQDLSAGVYNQSTRSAMLSIDTTEVFVTGQTTVQFPPFRPGPLLGSTDFDELFHEGDAFIFAFEPGITEVGCPA
jgi:hypothetical protein